MTREGERLVSVELVEDSADYRSAKALRHENGYVEWVESEEKRDGIRNYSDR